MKQTPPNSRVYLDGGHGVWFFCPGCRVHHCIRDDKWKFNGDCLLPTFSPSVLVHPTPTRPYVCHSFVTHGRIQFLSDCGHALAGKTVDLPVFDGWDQADREEVQA